MLVSASVIEFDSGSTLKRGKFFPYQPSETKVSQCSCDCNSIEFGLLSESSKNYTSVFKKLEITKSKKSEFRYFAVSLAKKFRFSKFSPPARGTFR